MTTIETALREAVEALRAQHADRLGYSAAKQRANSTCGDFKASPLSELIESSYMHGLGKQTADAINSAEEALRQQPAKEVLYQIRMYGSQTAWHDAGLSAYEVTLEKDRRTLYTKPQQPEAAGVAVVESSQRLHLGGFRIRAKSDQPMPVGAALHLHATAPPARVDEWQPIETKDAK